MFAKESISRRVLAIIPKHRGFGFVVVESLTVPLDWGFCACRLQSIGREIKALSQIITLVNRYQPDRVLIEKVDGNSRRGDRIRLLLASIENLAIWHETKLLKISLSKVRKVFGAFGVSTKEQLARVIAHHVPELAPLLPP